MKAKFMALILMSTLFFNAQLIGANDNTITVIDKTFKELISKERIKARVNLLGKQIQNDYKNCDQGPIFIGVLTGCIPFYWDLVRAAQAPGSEMDFIKVSSYHGGTTSSGTVELKLNVSRSIEGRDIIIVEDIVDTGRTMVAVHELLQAKNPRSIRIASLLVKEDTAVVDVPKIDYVGFTIEDKFVIGYGLDYAQKARNLKAVYALNDE